MNIYEKLQLARVRLLEQGIRKSGKNHFLTYSYIELSDFLPELQRIMAELKMTAIFQIEDETAKLKIIDTEKIEGNIIIFSLPFVFAENKQNQQIQNLGATITYLRRYLYLIAFEIIEADQIDNQPPQPPQPQQTPQTQQQHSDTDIVDEFINLLSRKDLKNVSIERQERLLNIRNNIDKNEIDTVKIKNAVFYLKTLPDKEGENDKSVAD